MSQTIKIFIKNNPFFHGMIKFIDCGCSNDRLYKTSIEKTDWEKIGDDWHNVGKDISHAIDKYQHDLANVKQ